MNDSDIILDVPLVETKFEKVLARKRKTGQ